MDGPDGGPTDLDSLKRLNPQVCVQADGFSDSIAFSLAVMTINSQSILSLGMGFELSSCTDISIRSSFVDGRLRHPHVARHCL